MEHTEIPYGKCGDVLQKIRIWAQERWKFVRRRLSTHLIEDTWHQTKQPVGCLCHGKYFLRAHSSLLLVITIQDWSALWNCKPKMLERNKEYVPFFLKFCSLIVEVPNVRLAVTSRRPARKVQDPLPPCPGWRSEATPCPRWSLCFVLLHWLFSRPCNS